MCEENRARRYGRRPRRIGGPTGRQAEISAWTPGGFRNLGQPAVPPFPQTK
ncbi:hypothetical protein C7S13_6809 [Burkholderia cepacia]|nr:hypothetical protein [Burkholderia cepacia]